MLLVSGHPTQVCMHEWTYSDDDDDGGDDDDDVMMMMMNEWTDTSLQYRHWRMCFEWLLQAFARWQPGNLFDIAAQPILEYRWIDSYTQLSLQTQFKVATVYSIHTQSLSWCSTGLVPNVLPRRDEGSGK